MFQSCGMHRQAVLSQFVQGLAFHSSLCGSLWHHCHVIVVCPHLAEKCLDDWDLFKPKFKTELDAIYK
jgi:hypothetical protein